MLIYFFNLRKLHPPLNIYSELETMLALRKTGMSYTDLAVRFNVKKDTIIYLCRKFDLGGSMSPPIKKSSTTRSSPKALYDEDTINPGKSYAEYIQDERERKWQRLTQSHIK